LVLCLCGAFLLHFFNGEESSEVYAEFGAFYESQWIGHSVKVAHDK